MNDSIINYAQCWEDSRVLESALRVNTKDSILSITSAGDNTLTLLLKKPKKITAIDLNPAQNFLFELKLVTSRRLNYEQYLSLLGVTNNSERLKLFSKIKPYLSARAISWWMNNQKVINSGIIHNGRFEKFLNFFRKTLLPFVHNPKTTNELLLQSNIQIQKNFYVKRWNTIKWRMYFYLATSKFILRNFARQKGMFKYTKIKNVSKQYFDRFESNLINIPTINNIYLHYCLTGSFIHTLPDYLQKKNFEKLNKNQTTKIEIISKDIITYLKMTKDNSYTKFNLSDIFEALSDHECNLLWSEIIRTSKKGAIIVYWDNLIPRPIPEHLFNIVKEETKLQQQLFQKDRVFFYGSLHIYKVIK